MKNRCTIYREKITAYLNQELEVSEQLALEEHIKTCSDCRLELKAEKAALDLLDQGLANATIPQALNVEQILSEPKITTYSIWRNPQFQTIAATVIILFSLALWLINQKVESIKPPPSSQTKEQTIRFGPSAFLISLQSKEKRIVSLRYAPFYIAISKEIKQQKNRATPLQPSSFTKTVVASHSQQKQYNQIIENSFQSVIHSPLSTFAVNVDPVSYTMIRHCFNENRYPKPDAIRIEEMVNYFNYNYPKPKKDDSFSIALEASVCPWNPQHILALVGIQTKQIDFSNLPPNNFLFVINTSTSMQHPHRLPLLKVALRRMIKDLRPEDRLGLIIFGNKTKVVLAPTTNKQKMMEAVRHLESGIETKDKSGVETAFRLTKTHFIKGGNNRIILATDTTPNRLVSRIIKKNRDAKIIFSILDFSDQKQIRSKLEHLAHIGKGNHEQINNLLDARKALVSEMGGTFFTVAKNIHIQVEFNPLHIKEYRLIGYKNQQVTASDLSHGSFNTDALGAGHSVSALYELVPVEEAPIMTSYSKNILKQLKIFNELMAVNINYQSPKTGKHHFIVKSLKQAEITRSEPSNNLRFSRAVAEFGLLLKNSKYKGNANFEQVLHDAKEAQGKDPNGWRNDFIQLVEKVRAKTH